MASARASSWHRDRAGVLRFAGGTLLAVCCAAAACSLDANGVGPSTQSAAGGGGQGNGTGSNAGGYGGSLTISAGGGSVASTTGTAGGAGGVGGAGGEGGGDPFECVGDGVFKDITTGHCYRHVQEGENWLNAEANCKLWGGQSAFLAAISSLPEWSVILAVLGPSQDIWLGGRDFDTADAVGFEWSNGELWGFAPDGAPPLSDPAHPCAKLKNGDLQAKACSESHEFLCERY